MSAPPYTLREMCDSDAPFIYSTWMKWARQSAKWLRLLPDRLFWDAHGGYRAHVEWLVSRSNVLVACDTETPEFVIGYVVVGRESGAVHMVFVESSFRRHGVAIDMLRSAVSGFGDTETVCTTNRPAWPVFAERWRLRFDPFAEPIAGERFRAWVATWRESWAAVVPCEAPVIPDVDAALSARAEEIAKQIASHQRKAG